MVDREEYNACMSTARRKGHEEGLAKGHAEGHAEGLAEGLAEGHAEGLAEGLAEGFAKGKKRGTAIANRKIAVRDKKITAYLRKNGVPLKLLNAAMSIK